MIKTGISKKAWLAGMLWSIFAAVTAFGMRGCRLIPDGTFFAHVRYAIAYGGLRGKALSLLMICGIILFSVSCWSCLLANAPRFRPSGILLAAFFALNTMCYISSSGELRNLWQLPQCGKVESLLYWFQLTVSYYLMIFGLATWLNCEAAVQPQSSSGSNKWLYALVILAGWGPVLLLRFPGYLLWDSARQILQFQGKILCEASHPLFLTVVFGSLFTLGQRLAGDFGGLAACSLLQTGLMLFALSVLCGEVSERRGKKRAGFLCAVFLR